jgi:hypothetical protein
MSKVLTPGRMVVLIPDVSGSKYFGDTSMNLN